jgi:hypothetical protein
MPVVDLGIIKRLGYTPTTHSAIDKISAQPEMKDTDNVSHFNLHKSTLRIFTPSGPIFPLKICYFEAFVRYEFC